MSGFFDLIMLNQSWEIHIRRRAWPPLTEILLRKRGETEPIFAAKKEQDVAIHEIPVDEFGK